MPEGGGGGGGGVPVPICWSPSTCLDPTGYLGIDAGRPRTLATREVIASASRSRNPAYRQWGMCEADALFKHNDVISSGSQLQGTCAHELVMKLEGQGIARHRAQDLMVWAYSTEAQQFAPLPWEYRTPDGSVPPPQPLFELWLLPKGQKPWTWPEWKTIWNIALQIGGSCIVVSPDPEAAIACIKMRVQERIVEYGIKFVEEHLSRMSLSKWKQFVRSIEKWLAREGSNPQPEPDPVEFSFPTPLDVPSPLAAGQSCASCDETEEVI